ncbi:hypothetical protein PGT21_020044 [Puccinia graminis f. sp. tritici]|uniref:Uncharacterized protein n=1 Tax=Puccinia graminis f. sp. tritici TaxID=56615 RepID=A0A5B0MUP9_PUCGR|nr:hypothetical protein PGT21_020044 [Puccinia graminis f. sp. tritici]
MQLNCVNAQFLLFFHPEFQPTNHQLFPSTLSPPFTQFCERFQTSFSPPEVPLGLEIVQVAQRAALYQPTPWELLTPQEQRDRALARVQLNEEKRIDNLFAFNALKRQHKNCRRELLAELKAKRLAKMSVTSSSSAATTPAAQTAVHSPISGPTTPTCTVPFPQPLDQGAASQLEERVNRLRLITIQKKLQPVLVEKPTEATLVKRDLTTVTTA